MADLPPVVKETLVGLHQAVREDFTRNRRVLSFSEYLALAFAEPTRQLRSSTQYIVDCFDHYGTEQVKFTAMNTLAKKYTLRIRQAR